ncbi:hypothetical protein [uncultured Helicobacter sp.]|uniref:hypothetical protein n=1 Tax=uncultured Helicobacter sp. TaxID=175537 RepID=UPI00374F535B
MKIYLKILYIGWLGFCLLVFVMYLGVAYQPHFFWGLFGSMVLAITPYLCFLCIFKIPVDFEIYCNKNNQNINDFKLFFKKYALHFLIPIMALMIFIVFNNSIISSVLLCGLPFFVVVCCLDKKIYYVLYSKILEIIMDTIKTQINNLKDYAELTQASYFNFEFIEKLK